MKPLATRTRDLAQSDIRAISKMVNAVQGINLGQGICDMPTPAPIKAGAHRAIEDDRSIYSAYDGIRALRQAILQKARTYNRIPATSDKDVMVSAGSTGAFVTAMFTLFDAGDEVLLFEPFYGYHRNLLRMMGVTPVFVPTHGQDFTVDFEEVERAVTPRTRALLITTPGNPGGKVWTRGELAQALALLQRHDLWAITDEIYEYMIYDGRAHVSLAALPDAFARTITLSGFSKTYNMTGWRLGYAVGPEPVIAKMGLLNDLIYICAPTPLQYGVTEAFSMDDSYFEQMLDDYTRKRKLMCETLEAVGFDVPWPQGAYYVLANFEALSRSRPGFADDKQACRTLIEEAGVGTVPGNSFFADPADGRFFLRFCFAKKDADLQEACRRLLNAFA